MRYALALVAIAACGDNASGLVDAPGVDAPPAFMTWCGTSPQVGTDPFTRAADFGPVVAGSMVFGTKAYFTYYQDGVRVLELANPDAPVQVGYYNTWDPQADYTSSDFFEGAVGIDVDLDRHLIFVADSPRGLLVLSDQTP